MAYRHQKNILKKESKKRVKGEVTKRNGCIAGYIRLNGKVWVNTCSRRGLKL